MKGFLVRVISMLLSATMLCAVASCGGKNDEPEAKKDLPERLSLNQATFTEGDSDTEPSWLDKWTSGIFKN